MLVAGWGRNQPAQDYRTAQIYTPDSLLMTQSRNVLRHRGKIIGAGGAFHPYEAWVAGDE